MDAQLHVWVNGTWDSCSATLPRPYGADNGYLAEAGSAGTPHTIDPLLRGLQVPSCPSEDDAAIAHFLDLGALGVGSESAAHHQPRGSPMKTPPSKTLIVDLQVAVRRLARVAAVMNISMMEGFPLVLLKETTTSVHGAAQDVLDLLGQARSEQVDMDALRVQIDQPVRDSLMDLFIAALIPQVPDTIEELTP